MKRLKRIIKDYCIKRFAPDYYDIKKERDVLYRDMYTLIKGSEADKAYLELNYRFYFSVEELSMSGEGTGEELKGFLN